MYKAEFRRTAAPQLVVLGIAHLFLISCNNPPTAPAQIDELVSEYSLDPWARAVRIVVPSLTQDSIMERIASEAVNSSTDSTTCIWNRAIEWYETDLVHCVWDRPQIEINDTAVPTWIEGDTLVARIPGFSSEIVRASLRLDNQQMDLGSVRPLGKGGVDSVGPFNGPTRAVPGPAGQAYLVEDDFWTVDLAGGTRTRLSGMGTFGESGIGPNRAVGVSMIPGRVALFRGIDRTELWSVFPRVEFIDTLSCRVGISPAQVVALETGSCAVLERHAIRWMDGALTQGRSASFYQGWLVSRTGFALPVGPRNEGYLWEDRSDYPPPVIGPNGHLHDILAPFAVVVAGSFSPSGETLYGAAHYQNTIGMDSSVIFSYEPETREIVRMRQTGYWAKSVNLDQTGNRLIVFGVRSRDHRGDTTSVAVITTYDPSTLDVIRSVALPSGSLPDGYAVNPRFGDPSRVDVWDEFNRVLYLTLLHASDLTIVTLRIPETP